MRGSIVGGIMIMVALALGADVLCGDEDIHLVYGFESDEELDGLGFAGTDRIRTMQPERVTQGKAALAVTFKKFIKGQTSQWPGWNISDRKRVAGWEKYDLLIMDVSNLMSDKVRLCFRFDDAKTKDYETRAHSNVTLIPGSNTVVIPLKALRRENKEPFDIAQLKSISIFLSTPKEDIQFVFDNIRLQMDVGGTIDIPNAHLFDFSSEGALRFNPFTKVTPKDGYSSEKGYGFEQTDGLRGSGKSMPDDLSGDHVSSRKPFSFRADVPDGTYRVVYILNQPGVNNYTISANGVEHKIEWTSQELFSVKGIYAGMDHDFTPGMDVWKTYVDSAWPTGTALVSATEGKIVVRVSGVKLAALIVYPEDQSDAMQSILADITKQRRKQFSREYCTVKLTLPEGPAEPTILQKRTGYVLYFPLRTGITVTPATSPGEEPKDPRLEFRAAQGQREPATFAVHPLTDIKQLSVVASDLKSDNGAVIPASAMEVRLVRYFLRPAGSGSYAPTPMQLIEPTTGLYKGLPRQFWVSLNVPSGTRSGFYVGRLILSTGTASRILPVQAEIYPFDLPHKSRAALGWYYVGPGVLKRLISRFDDAPLTFEQALEQQFLDLKRHGTNSLQVPHPQITAFNGKRITFDYSELDTYVKLMKKHGMGLNGQCQMFEINIPNYLKRRGLKEFSSEFNEVFKTALAEFDKWFKDRGLEVIHWLVDEPREQAINPWNRNLADTIKYLKVAREVPGIKTTIAVMADTNFGTDYSPMVPLMDILQTHPRPSAAKIIGITAEEGGPLLWFDNPGKNRISYGFHLWKLNGIGCWQWHYQWGDTSYNPFVGYHWAVSYHSPDGPVPTLEHEQVSMGMTDYRYLELLENRIAAAKGKGADTSRAQALLARLRQDIPQWPMDAYGDGTDAGREYKGELNRIMDTWRAEIAQEIVNLD